MTAVVVVGGASPVYALDCAQASARVDKLICASPSLRKADAAMSTAYFELLRKTTDREFHDALIRSQQRWLKVRSQGARGNRQPEDDDGDDERQALLQITRERTDLLQAADPIHRMERQRQVAAGDSGGAFAGYKTSCYLLPLSSGWIYGCSGEGRRQNNDRICSVERAAEIHQTERRTVGILKDGALKLVATCSIGYGGTTERCPDPDDDAEIKAIAHWNTNPGPSDDSSLPPAIWKYDPDTSADLTDQDWMQDCLTAATYPPADVSRADPAPKKR